jgi:hypothetical protein
MLPSRPSFSIILSLVAGSILFLSPVAAVAQHRGGGQIGGAVPGANGRPDGVDETDTLQGFHNALAVQASPQQIADFQDAVKLTNTAKEKLGAFVRPSADPTNENSTDVSKAVENAGSANRKFLGGFSDAQKSGLKETVKRLEKTDADLVQAGRQLDASVQARTSGAEVSGRVESVDKALKDFSGQQLALGREMGILLASGQDLAFDIPAVKQPVSFGSRKITVGTSSELAQTGANDGQRTFKLEMVVDLSDLQTTATEVLRTQLEESSRCGERLEVRQASIEPTPPASSVVLQLHFERWSCPRILGQNSPTEIAEGEGSVEIKLTPAIGEANSLKLLPEFIKIQAQGMLGDELRSGDRGDDLREKVAKSVLLALQAGADVKSTLPGAVQSSATLETARFRDAGAGGLSVELNGKVQASNEQVNLLASQLNHALSAQAQSSQPPPQQSSQ